MISRTRIALAVVAAGLAVASCGSADDTAGESLSSTTTTTAPATSAASGEPVSSSCEAGPGGFVDDAPGDVPAGLDVVSADLASDGENLEATITLAGPHTELAPEAPGEGLWYVTLLRQTGLPTYQISASLLDGTAEYQVFDYEKVRSEPVAGSLAGNVVTITVPMDKVPGFGLGWFWNAGTEAGIETLTADWCPGPRRFDVLEVGQA